MSAPGLTELAALAGIEPVVRDYFGREREVSPEVAAALLGAMGIDAAGGDAIAASIRQLREERWRSPLPPAIVVEESGPPAFTCVAPEGTREVLWRLTLETGEEYGGVIDWNAHAVVEAARVDGVLYERRTLRLEVEPPLGYHELLLEINRDQVATAFIITPNRAYSYDERRRWVLAAQLYALRSDRNWGIGDFADLAHLGAGLRRLGAGAVALNPLHALYPCNPASASPYSASSRRFLNPLYLDVEAIPDFAECAEARQMIAQAGVQSELQRLRETPQVDYPAVARLKFGVLHLLWAWFKEQHLRSDDSRGRAFASFRQRGGTALTQFARYEAIAMHRARGEQVHVPWQIWPEELQDPGSEAVAKFARKHASPVAEAMYFQWLAEGQLAAARAAGPQNLGLYLDQAVGVDAGGAEVWANRAVFPLGASLGAPPDELNAEGQDWGLLPFNPRPLRDQAYEPFVAILRANMARAGALRIDHVMSLMRAYWIAPGFDATQGAYVRYPLDDMLGIVALESVRNRCMVIGEDLGTVPAGFRERLTGRRVLGCRLLVFEREGERFRPPAEYEPRSVASLATHDLPPLALWWLEAEWETRHALIAALEEAGALEPGGAQRLREVDPADAASLLAPAVHRFLAATASEFVAVQLEDVFGEFQRTNVPGTVAEHPNWEFKRARTMETLFEDERMKGLTSIFSSRDARNGSFL